jgi:hypothetical protein
LISCEAECIKITPYNDCVFSHPAGLGKSKSVELKKKICDSTWQMRPAKPKSGLRNLFAAFPMKGYLVCNFCNTDQDVEFAKALW